MNQTDTTLEDLERIISQVRAFREDPENLEKGAYGPHLSHFLKQRLTPDDWEVWQSLQLDWELSK